ncbi:hypothetical protein ACJRO7_023297 [Eucalyptus globulus]|uniref:folate gamma-glutamyl hydrolase n=1 Tax=Eucalyptus globulus TaxID=34317 RepID=A0ABD3K1D3_EUCGL
MASYSVELVLVLLFCGGLNMVNGVLFTGGWAKTGLYHETVKAIFKKVLAKNDAGDHFPLYAICLGFELLTMIISKDKSILEEFNAADQASTLQYIRKTNIEGTVFQRFSPDLLKKPSTDCLVMQNHHYGISPERLIQKTDLMNFFKVSTTSTDGDKKVSVSTVQAHSYPVTAFQWHPEGTDWTVYLTRKHALHWGNNYLLPATLRTTVKRLSFFFNYLFLFLSFFPNFGNRGPDWTISSGPVQKNWHFLFSLINDHSPKNNHPPDRSIKFDAFDNYFVFKNNFCS